MTFGAPVYLWGLTSILALILLSFWRLRPARVAVPSVALWRRLPANVPPVRALRRPRWSVTLLLQSIAVAAAVTALAQPMTVRMAPAPRMLAVVADLGARARLDRVREELAAIKAATEGDDVVMYETPVLRRGPLRLDVGKVDYLGDPTVALQLARDEGRRVIWIGDRPAGADLDVLTGGASENAGIVDLAIDRDGAFVRLLNLGPERDLSVRVGGRAETWRLPAGESTRVLPVQADAELFRIELPADDFPLDDVATAAKADRIDIELRGRPHRLLKHALEVQPGGRLVDRGGSLIVSLGEAVTGPAVIIDPPGGTPVAPGVISLADHPLARGLKAEDIRIENARPLGPEFVPVVHADGRTVIGVRGRTVVVSASLGDWPLTPSFPIFFANVLESARAGRGLWRVRRTGPGAPLAGPELSLLDRDASDLGRERRPFRPPQLGEAPLKPARSDGSGWMALAALGFMGAAWWRESRGSS